MIEPNGQWVEVEFDCMPLRSLPRVDAPLDASPKLAAKMLRVKHALEKHGSLNTYYLHNARCTYHLTNDPLQGMMEFEFEGVVLTDEQDLSARSCELQVSLVRETCSWLNQSIVDWLAETVRRNVLIEFNRYISAGDLTKTLERIERTRQASDESGGYVGMFL
jgi:hypothetical protein